MPSAAKCKTRWRKPVSQISDRAKRYRANCVKKPGKRCEDCGARTNLGIGHKDGNESNNRPSNLFTQCKSCNGKDAVAAKKSGRGVRTRQYNGKGRRRNAGAGNLAQYVQAAVEHTRGAHDEGGRVIHETSKAKRREFAREIAWRKGYRGNPDTMSQAEADKFYKKFHGVKPDNRLSFRRPAIDPYSKHPDLGQCGLLIRLVVGEGVEIHASANPGEEKITAVEDYGWCAELTFTKEVPEFRRMERSARTQTDIDKLKAWLRRNGTPDIAAVPNTAQLYIVGGNQNIDDKLAQLGADPGKEIIDCGFCYVIEYYTQKRFDHMQPTDYFHQFGEKTGVPPRLIYWREPKLLQLVGGEYFVTARGIEN